MTDSQAAAHGAGRAAWAWRRFRANRAAVAAAVFLVAAHAAALAAPILASRPYDQIDLRSKFASPSRLFPLGTDETGRDILSRLLYGARVSLGIGFVSVVIAIGVGTALGGLAGYGREAVDAVIMRTADGMLSVPLFFIILTALALWGTTLTNLVLAIALTSWMTTARIVRGEVLRGKALDFVAAARALGAGDGRILWLHLLPHSVPSIIVASTLGVAYAILTESALSYLGLGVQPPVPSWGNMLSGARGYLWNAPHLAFYPGLLILVTVLAYNFLGDGLSDALEPATQE
jgi:peptide/nickel transport system permease protein